MARLDLIEPYAVRFARQSIRDSLSSHGEEVVLMHAYPGYPGQVHRDARTPEELTALVTALRERGTPFVYTVHDLRNPHHLDSALHNAALDVLMGPGGFQPLLTRAVAAATKRSRELAK